MGYSEMVTLINIGKSYEDRDVYAIQVSLIYNWCKYWKQKRTRKELVGVEAKKYHFICQTSCKVYCY